MHRESKGREKAHGSRRPHPILHSTLYLRPSAPHRGRATGRVPTKAKAKAKAKALPPPPGQQLGGYLAGAHATHVNHEVHATRNQQGMCPAHAQPAEWGIVRGGRPGQCVEEQGTWAPHTRKRSEAGCGRPEDGGVGTPKTVKRPPQQPAPPQYANYWALLTRKRHIPPRPAQPQHTNHWAPRTRKRHQQEHRPQRPTESSDPTQHAEGRTGDCPGPRKETTTRRNVTQGVVCVQTQGVRSPSPMGSGSGLGGRPEEEEQRPNVRANQVRTES